MENETWVKLYRKFESWEWYTKPNMAHFFIWLLLRASHKDRKFRGMELKTGQLVFGRKMASKATGLSEKQIRTCISLLKQTREVAIQRASNFSIISILNYQDYQEKRASEGASKRAKEGPEEGHIQEYKNIRNKENTYKEPTRFSPPSLEEVVSFFSTMGRTDGAVFFDHFTSNGWKVGGKTPMKDWHAAARNWDRRSPVKKGYDIWQTKHVQIPK